jgi:hypothetical protein
MMSLTLSAVQRLVPTRMTSLKRHAGLTFQKCLITALNSRVLAGPPHYAYNVNDDSTSEG